MEVLVALAVVTIALAATIRAVGIQVDQTTYVRDKTFAQWVGLNRIAELRALAVWPDVGETTDEEEMGGRVWYWRETIAQLSDEDLRQVEIEVSTEKGFDADPLITVTGYLLNPEITVQPEEP
jgi:general secretion pathway protein I